MNILFTVCGRAGSKGLKNKNLKLMNGTALVYYTLAAIVLYKEAHRENYVEVALNTDSQDLIELVNEQNLLENVRVIERKEALAGDLVSKLDVIKDTYLQCKKFGAFDVVVDLDITSPLRRLIDIENAIEEFCSKKVYDVVFGVVPARRNPYFNMVEKNGEFYKKVCASTFTARQQAPEIYEMNASIYAFAPDFLESDISKTLLEYRCGIIEMKDYLVLDIDSEEDFERMSQLMRLFEVEDVELAKVIQKARQI